MDKFDQLIKESEKKYEPKSNFVEDTMSKISNKKPKKRFNFKIWSSVLAGGLAVIAVLFIALPHSSSPTTANNASATTTNKSQGVTQTTSPQASTATPAAGTDNTSLNNDLNSVQSSINQENSDQNNANTMLNDSQNQISVPTT